MNKLVNMTIGLIFSQLRMEETWNLCVNLRKPAETRKGFLYCWNCTATYYIMFQLTETLRKLLSSFPHCWNLTETYTSGFSRRKLDGIQLKLYNRFYIAETILETSTLSSFYLVSAVFQFCWKGIFIHIFFFIHILVILITKC